MRGEDGLNEAELLYTIPVQGSVTAQNSTVQATLFGLKPFSTYSISIVACVTSLCSPRNVEQNFTTRETRKSMVSLH